MAARRALLPSAAENSAVRTSSSAFFSLWISTAASAYTAALFCRISLISFWVLDTPFSLLHRAATAPVTKPITANTLVAGFNAAQNALAATPAARRLPTNKFCAAAISLADAVDFTIEFVSRSSATRCSFDQKTSNFFQATAAFCQPV